VKTRDQLPIDVLKKFRLIYGSVRHQFREVEKKCGISGSQLWVLQEVGLKPGTGVSELAERISIHQSTCSQLVEKLVSRGLIIKKRSKEDQRRVGLTVSKAGAGVLAKAPGPAEGILPNALMALPKGVLSTLDLSLAELIGQLRIHDEKYADKPLGDW
jgi:DNA-binding MarR family transcriptional regulator